jgi:sulfur-oxidizing protein SoxY
MPAPDRRVFLKQSLAATLLGAAAAAGLLRPRRALAAEWPRPAFEAQNVADALRLLYGEGAAPAVPGAITIQAPLETENGAAVPIVVTTGLPDVDAIAVFGDKNPIPLIASTAFTGARPRLSLRVKLAESSALHVAVRSAGQIHTTQQRIVVTAGGCGG